MDPVPKTLDEHIDFHFRLARLKLWFAWTRARACPNEAFVLVLRRRTWLWGLTPCATHGWPVGEDAYARPDWQRLLQPLLALYEAAPDAAAFEEGGFAIFRDALEERARATFGRDVPAPHGAMGALSYNPPTPEHPDRVHFHISNPLQPRSIFDDPAYLPRCLRALMDDAAANHGVRALQTGSWLNSHPIFLRHFPREYLDNMGPDETDIRGGGGFWGQFTNARGCFNQKHADSFRRTGRLLYWRRTSWCTFAALRDHLDRQERTTGGE